MAKTQKSQMELATSFKNGFCPYCGKSGATLDKNKNRRGGYHGNCPNCHATPNFSSGSIIEMIEAWATSAASTTSPHPRPHMNFWRRHRNFILILRCGSQRRSVKSVALTFTPMGNFTGVQRSVSRMGREGRITPKGWGLYRIWYDERKMSCVITGRQQGAMSVC